MMRVIILLFTSLLAAGCTSVSEVVDTQPPEEVPYTNYPTFEANTDGSLFNSNYGMALFQDRRAFRVGDILTVVLDEQTRSSKKAGTSFGKESNTGITVPKFAGTPYPDAEFSMKGDRDFKGSSSSSQQNSLSGSITVLVSEVMPNGVLRVRGEKWLKLNQGNEYIRLSGLARVDDIDGGNRISSQRLGDARITYSGRGTLADANEAGWLSRFFNSSWFPI
ncbi:flagellar basal body L-ring protein [Photobacterium jeanii]|uniref:Flagellar L-ring protein n=1 Tax=Photobacterium jeanii TaxID=858640 RepID=A0A178KHG2_9GAMM|nr:flagellar basal body L-ring protein FlgH [Photobacterium jeanii]OAN16717.1 flagellar basal body L-ring protein [Photobacterium jeanii]PST87446.1 flagellar basal body L-ring protein FlgH [Photobacterium jeanii]